MPAISPQELVGAILDAIQECGSSAVLISSARTHPRRFAVTGPRGESVSLWVYAWTLTPGGRPQLQHEYRIQMTSVSSPLILNPAGRTVLLGYDPNLRMFAGFDLARHRTFSQGSPSVQIDIRVVQQAQQDGISFDRKDNREIAIGVRPDQLLSYVTNAEPLHRLGADAQTFQPLSAAAAANRLSSEEESRLDDDLARLTEPRRVIVQEVRRLSRLAGFRQQVLFAYGQRCAITRMQLRLIDAAHVLPVGTPGSIDHVCNGIALAPTYHRAYDNGLIFLDETYVMRLNEEKVEILRREALVEGMSTFKEPLGKIFLPPDRNQWPNLRYIRRANSFRYISLP